MIAFHVYLNGQRVATAGVGERGVLNATVVWARNTFENEDIANPPEANEGGTWLTVGGLAESSCEHLRWQDGLPLQTGSEVRIEIVSLDSVDEPSTRVTHEPSDEQRDMKLYLKRMAQQFGWTLLIPDEEPQPTSRPQMPTRYRVCFQGSTYDKDTGYRTFAYVVCTCLDERKALLLAAGAHASKNPGEHIYRVISVEMLAGSEALGTDFVDRNEY